jgi:hypothetical protein
MCSNKCFLLPRGRGQLDALAIISCLAITVPAQAITVFNGANGGIAFGVAPLGGPVSPGAPTYLNNINNGRNDILTNPGIGLTASPSIPNNTLSVGPLAWGPGQFIYGVQNGGGNINGPFGSGAAVITGPRFGYRLADGGIPGGFSASYEIMSWTAGFTQLGGAPVGTTGTFITMGGRVPFAQDLAMVSLRTVLNGPTIGAVELPGLILAVERTGPLSYNSLALQDNLLLGTPGGATPMGGGWAMLIDAPTGNFRALAYNVLPDLGAIDGLSIPNGEVFTATVTATVYCDPAHFEMLDPLALENADLLAAALASNNTPFPIDSLFGNTDTVPEPASIGMVLVSLIGLVASRRGLC